MTFYVIVEEDACETFEAQLIKGLSQTLSYQLGTPNLVKTFSFGDNVSDTCWAAWDYAMYTVDSGKQIDTDGL